MPIQFAIMTRKNGNDAHTVWMANDIFRYTIGSVTSFRTVAIATHASGMFLAELVVAVGSVDLVVGELDR